MSIFKTATLLNFIKTIFSPSTLEYLNSFKQKGTVMNKYDVVSWKQNDYSVCLWSPSYKCCILCGVINKVIQPIVNILDIT